ncbi:Nucleoside-specific outer membrane channel protein Tsx [Mariprofundus ferrinatatus]|uniref:Nucleoside-specific outer membrane channel protein Tsx n=1 Tax=Mariprofundus ferrinatatus TaxID=1921087 RepID=A0A2K8L5Q1_9PROT|nr:outer membrane protein OmpK [Mariprofundus ferrinatatus]ATX82617.1 Nucleoside-specific outer membrane channel protein Tsx [Mariprofundus ferrinatatus]
MHGNLKRLFRTVFLCASLLCYAPAASLADNFSTTNLQLLYGTNFHDNYYGNNTSDGNMTTLTLEHFSTWSYGDNYLFVDLLSGNFLDFAGSPTGSHTRIYSEWAPRLSLSAISGHDLSIGIFKDFFLAGQLNRDGDGFHAELIGLGTDLSIPGFNLLSIHAYLRKDNFNRRTWQTTTVWSVPFGTWMSFEGFIDIYGSDSNGTEIGMQPQLLLDIGNLFGQEFDNLSAGIEWDYHHNRFLNSSVLQGMIKWVW